jgi:hypothetical protein
MGKLTKNQKREKTKADVKQSRQTTIDNLSYQFNIPKTKAASKSAKEIFIDNIAATTKEDELILIVGFSLFPSKAAFSKIILDLYLQEHLLDSTTLSIPQSELLNDSFEYPQILDMKGIAAGSYLFRVEMYELWSSGEKLNINFKDVAVEYVPQTRASRLVKIPTVKKAAGTDLTVVSSNAKNIYRDIEQNQRKEYKSRKDEW